MQSVRSLQVYAKKVHEVLLPGVLKRKQTVRASFTYMCNVPREGSTETCFQIWHADWNNGNKIPRELEQEQKSRNCPPVSRPGKKRRRRPTASSQPAAPRMVAMLTVMKMKERSRFNPMRQFNKDKHHRCGTKVFVAACAKTGYCMRQAHKTKSLWWTIEVYCGAKTHLRTPVPRDNNSGEAPVLRKLNALLPSTPTSPWRLIVTDRFYTSDEVALELINRRFIPDWDDPDR
ncbi:hypothetical protein PC129_g7661 [Phytophthora cactorum]|uniref:PiggyBac transposable element-derived protein domain-containing protein n=1 Tax=Phytophthora cactorum TaxID=29920 RepID=A0A8T0YXH2_9STRA|nr:hypothetical protein PC111_g11898 [Phytophthora cactorum]KAG2854350.1 hypothetical protein PC113_g13393 [Phytophthora cactorum]KAG2912152.1 hypothetical protein PC115_g12414 [Phytophthora cactorum]KAG2930876.1 hypothetical protein PC117_g13636 [Phytophthora cactorum]KAG2977136.1 hypothetical protein PC118_g13070 [Phytophthora cactorum]